MSQFTSDENPHMSARITDVLDKVDAMRQANAEIQRDYRESRIAKRRARNLANAAKAMTLRPAEWSAKVAKHAAKRHADRLASRQGVNPDDLARADLIVAESPYAADWRCGYCGQDAPIRDRTTDHIIAISDGGKHTPTNLRPACRACNSRKGAASSYYA